MENIDELIDTICLYSLKSKNNIKNNILNITHYSILLKSLNFLIRTNYNIYNTEKASNDNNIKLLNYLYKLNQTKNKEFFIPFFYSKNCIIVASQKNNIDILNWWWNKKEFRNIFYTLNSLAIDWASSENCLDVLIWFKQKHNIYNIPFNYSSFAIDSASIKGNLDILNWWLQNFDKKLLKYTTNAFDGCNNIYVLDWWFTNFENILYSINCLNYCTNLSKLNYLYDKFIINKFDFIYNYIILDNNLNKKNYYILDWWFDKFKKNKCLKIVINKDFINKALIYKDKYILERVLEFNNIKLEYNKFLINASCKCLCVKYLNSNNFFIS